ncbi:MAG: ABC transporter permease, partial [Desulfobacterales bacterium]|nr:ABC transporter permease [Desulfobacterales bacterium]
MRALNRKLLRDLYAMKGQAFAIALVIASGVAVFVMSITTLNALHQTRADFYKEYFFADVFLSLKRAPEGLRLRIEEIPGVDMVETRVAAAVNLTIKDYSGPVTGQLFSVPDSGKPLLNQLYLRQGRMIEAGRDDEVIASESFAQSHGFKPGSKLSAVINGRLKNLTIVGIALSPEHVYQIAPGSLFPDFERYGILWMGRKPLGTAYNMEGAFNNVSLILSPGAQIKDVIERLDKLIEPYGGLGAYGRKDQLSNRYLSEEFRQLANTATIFPIIFLGVAAFLLNLVVSRLINMQREQVAALKAFGYSNYAVGMHYLKLIILIILPGVAGGVLLGLWFGRGLSEMYMEYYRFPFLRYEFQPGVAAIAAL